MNYEEIRVAQIAQQADIARATFYLHYRTKEELMMGYIDDMFQRFYDEVEEPLSRIEQFDEQVAIAMFETFKREAAFSQLLRQTPVRPILHQRFQNYLARMFGRMIRSAGVQTLSPEHLRFAIDYSASGSLSLLATWVEKGFSPDSATMGKLYFNIIKNGLWETLGLTEAL